MITKSYYRFVHTVDVYKKIITTNDAGQRFSTYEFDTKVPVIPQSRKTQFSAGAVIRTVPYQEYIPPLEIIFPGMYADKLILTSRISNITDRYGNVLEAGPYEVIALHPKFGFNGKKAHIVAELRTVVEQS